MSFAASFVKDPGATLDYTWDWSSWLSGGDVLSSVSFLAPGLSVVSFSNTGSSATVFLSGGTSGVSYPVSCQVTTVGGRVDERTVLVQVQGR